MKDSIHIGIVDDHIFVRQGLISLLREFKNIKVLFDVGSGKELLEALADSIPEIVLLDIEMPVMNGREALDKMRQKYPDVKVIMVSMHFTDAYIIEFIKKGAVGFLNKTSGIEKIIDALYAVHQVGYYYDSYIAQLMAKAISNTSSHLLVGGRPDLHLSDREIQIIRLLCMDKTNAQIAESVAISLRTVEGHRYRIRRKTGCKSKLELNRFAIQHNLVGAGSEH